MGRMLDLSNSTHCLVDIQLDIVTQFEYIRYCQSGNKLDGA